MGTDGTRWRTRSEHALDYRPRQADPVAAQQNKQRQALPTGALKDVPCWAAQLGAGGMSTSRKRARRAPEPWPPTFHVSIAEHDDDHHLSSSLAREHSEGRAVRLRCLLRWVAAARQLYHGRLPTHTGGVGGLSRTSANRAFTSLVFREKKRFAPFASVEAVRYFAPARLRARTHPTRTPPEGVQLTTTYEGRADGPWRRQCARCGAAIQQSHVGRPRKFCELCGLAVAKEQRAIWTRRFRRKSLTKRKRLNHVG